ncbi:transcriptional regulator GcvA [Alcaligenes sp. SDU_A2]|uniref:transcriptional regulator GcvA n=1 Tax=Alcaligenes sp. SDU_A2 TaxID=3136634 RepID=UPI00311E6686
MKRRLPPLNAVRAFEAAARHLSFTAAAQELHVTHSAISQQVKQLEGWLDMHLFLRQNSTLVLTDKGRAYLLELRQALDTIDIATQNLQSTRHDTTLTLSVLPNFALHWLVPRLPGFQQRHPDIRLRLLSGTVPLQQLYESCDLAIRPYQNAPEFQFDHICGADMLPVMSPAFARRHAIRTPADLQAAPKLHITHSPQDWPRWLGAHGLQDRYPAQGMLFDSHAVALQAAINGLGALMGLTPFIQDMIDTGKLMAPFPDTVQTERTWYLVAPRGRLPHKATCFRDWLLEQVTS